VIHSLFLWTGWSPVSIVGATQALSLLQRKVDEKKAVLISYSGKYEQIPISVEPS